MQKLFIRLPIMLGAVLLQVFLIYSLSKWLSSYSVVINVALTLLSFVFALYIITKHDEGTYKILWLLIILLLPFVGAVMYAIFGNKRTAKPLGKRIAASASKLPSLRMDKPSEACMEIARHDYRVAQTIRQVERQSGYPTLQNQHVEYYPVGDLMLPRALDALEQARRYIFIEYFIIEHGVMFDSIVSILERKVSEGVDVRLMYDDWGSVNTFSQEELDALCKKGIKCIRFNPLLIPTGTSNYRDHRKILVVDGVVAFSGGINLADEYINVKRRFGHWKDDAFKVEGEPALLFARMFIEFWNAFSNDPVPRDLVELPKTRLAPIPSDGYVLTYYDSPVLPANISNDLYVDLLAQSTDYAWFYTPYLLPSESLLNAFIQTAQRGVDVRIVLPGIPDKPLVYRMSRSYYRTLLEAGVRVFEYTPGFVHSKGCVIDGKLCAVGTVNLDYRSLFLHYENNSLFYRSRMCDLFASDFLTTQEKCRERTLDDVKSTFVKWLVDGVLRIFSPLC